MLKLKKILKFIIIFTLLFILFLVSIHRFCIPIKQKYYNNKLLKNKTQYTIICLGESTTAAQYPIQLQQILDEKYPEKFSVIDCGIIGAKLDVIFGLLDENINKYKPNIAICMMGSSNVFVYGKKQKKESETVFFSIYRFIKSFFYNLFNVDVVFADDNVNLNNKIIEIVKLKKKSFTESERYLKSLLEKNPRDEIAFGELTVLYAASDDLEIKKISYDMAKEGIINNFQYCRNVYYKIIFNFSKFFGDTKTLNTYINYLIDKDIKMFDSQDKYGIFSVIEKDLSEEQKQKVICVLHKSRYDSFFAYKAIKAMEGKNYLLAKKYFDKAEEIRLKFPNIKTYDLYRQIIKKLTDNNIKVICMQYPMRSIKPLQEQLKNESCYDKITFVSNEQLFKEALMERNYFDLFIDNSGGDFGHCTNLGNTMIAENVVNSLENILNLKH